MDADHALLANLLLSRAVVERAAERRDDADALTAFRADPRARVLRVRDGASLVRLQGEDAARLEYVSAVDVAAEEDLTFLGVDDEGVAFFAQHVPDEPADATDGVLGAASVAASGWQDLRIVGERLDAQDAGLMVTAVALDHWHRSHRHCPRCGAATRIASAGWARSCPEDGSLIFPRTDPAVIVLVRDRTDRALLGRQARWQPGWFSTLAGCVEAGESAEAAVRREVLEESGVVIAPAPEELQYLGSQPWPFPCSLMLGYHAWTDDPTVAVDGEEIAEARWFSRDELAAACATGEVRLPPPISIARRLVERWYGAPLPGDWSRPLGAAR